VSSRDELRLSDATHNTPTDHRQVLSLSGGGYRGLYTALVLEALEAKAQCPLRETFDVLAGSSIGGLIAAALAMGVSASDIARAIEVHGPSIFDRRIQLGRLRIPVTNPTRFLYRPRYAQGPLVDAIQELLDDKADMPMVDVETPLLIAAVNTDTGKPSVLMSKGLAGGNASGITLKDALLATSAAPTYFPSHVTQNGTYVDGGLIANAPDLVAVTETVRKLGCDLNRTRVLSVGTTGAPHIVSRSGRTPGTISWLLARGLVQLTLSAQEELAIDQCEILLGDRFLRLDERLDPLKKRSIGLDDASDTTTKALHRAAQATIRALSTTNRAAIRRFLSHRTQGPRRPPLG